MKFLSRMLVMLVILSGLGYGSYTLGRYVLSKHLFGALNKKGTPSVVSASVGKTDLRGGKPRVEVEVLPANSAAQVSEAPSNDALEKRAADLKPDSRASLSRVEKSNGQSSNADASRNSSSGPSKSGRLGERQFDDARGMRVDNGVEVEDGTSRERRDSSGNSTRRRSRSARGDDDEDRPRRRRRRFSEATLRRTRTDSSSARRDSTSDLPSRAESRNYSDDNSPRRRRSESRGDSGGSSGGSESPIPRAEGGGDESPIPNPE